MLERRLTVLLDEWNITSFVQHRYISADNHLDSTWLPKDLWQTRVGARFRSRAPRVVETPQGSVWEWEGRARDPNGGPSGGGPSADGSSNARLLAKTFGVKGIEVPKNSRPPADPVLLLEHLDLAGIYAGVFYGDTRKWDVEDGELRQEIYRAYNDFVLELSSHAPERLLVLPTLPSMHPEFCLRELTRVVGLGAKAVEFSVYDAEPGLWSEAWEPLWEAAQGLSIPICMHIGAKSGTPYLPFVRGRAHAHFSIVPMTPAQSMAQLIFSGVLERYPKLNFSFAECRIGWVPFLLDWMDRQVRTRDPDPTVKLSLLPSEYFARQMTVVFEEDFVGVQLIPQKWTRLRETAMWGADYPHTQGVWPQTQEALTEMFAHLDADLVHEVVYGRAARTFRIGSSPKSY